MNTNRYLLHALMLTFYNCKWEYALLKYTYKDKVKQRKILNIPCHNDHIIYVVIYNLLHATVSVPGVSHSLPVLEAETNGRTNLPTNVSVAISTTSSSALHSAAQSSGTTWLVMLSQSSRVHGSGQPGRWSS